MKATTTQCDEFLSYEMKLRSFDGAAANGTYSFPFSVMLPLGLPSSMKVRYDLLKRVVMRLRLCCAVAETQLSLFCFTDVSHASLTSTSYTLYACHKTESNVCVGYFPLMSFRAPTVVVQERKDGDECSIEYGLEAELDRPNLFRFDAKDKKKIKIFNKPQDTAANVPIRMEPETTTVRNWCCSSKGRSVAAIKLFPVVHPVLNRNTVISVSRGDTVGCRPSRISVGSLASTNDRQG